MTLIRRVAHAAIVILVAACSSVPKRYGDSVDRGRDAEEPCLTGTQDDRSLKPAEHFDACYMAGVTPYMVKDRAHYYVSQFETAEMRKAAPDPEAAEDEFRRREPFIRKACELQTRHFARRPPRQYDACVIWAAQYKRDWNAVGPHLMKVCSGVLLTPPSGANASGFRQLPTSHTWSGYDIYWLDSAGTPEQSCRLVQNSRGATPDEKRTVATALCRYGEAHSCLMLIKHAAWLKADAATVAWARDVGYDSSAVLCEHGNNRHCRMLNDFLPGDPRTAEVMRRQRENSEALMARLAAQEAEEIRAYRAEAADRRRRIEASNQAALQQYIAAAQQQFQQNQAAMNAAAQSLARAEAERRRARPEGQPTPAAPQTPAAQPSGAAQQPRAEPDARQRRVAECKARPITPMRRSQTNPFCAHAGSYGALLTRAERTCAANPDWKECMGANAVLWPDSDVQRDYDDFEKRVGALTSALLPAKTARPRLPAPSGWFRQTREFCLTAAQPLCLQRLRTHVEYLEATCAELPKLWEAEYAVSDADAERRRDAECERQP